MQAKQPDAAVIQRNSRVSLTDQLNEILRRELTKFKPGDRFYTDREVCRRYGVSPPVARTVLARLAAEGLIRREISKGTFVEKPRPAGAASPAARRIAVFCPMTGYCPHSAAVQGIEEVCRTEGFDVLIRPNRQEGAPVDAADMASLLKAALKNVDGVIWVGSILEELQKWPAALAAMARRLVTVNIFARTGQITSVARDDAVSAFILAGHMIECGFRRIGYIGGVLQRTSAAERYAGVVRALRENGIDYDAPWIVPYADGMVEEAGRAAISRLIAEKNIPEALICVTDRMAVAVAAELQASGCKIPGDVALAAFDNSPAAEQSRPPLTSIDSRFPETGRMAARLLLDQLNGATTPGALHRIPGRLVIRDSTGIRNIS